MHTIGTINKTISMLEEIKKFSLKNPDYLEQTELPDELSNIYQQVLECGQSHIPRQDRSF